MVYGHRTSHLPHLLICLLRAYHIVYAAHQGHEISQSLPLYPHSGPEARVERRRNPCCAEVGARVEVRKGLRALEAYELAEVAGEVEVEERDEEGLPCGELVREDGGDAANEGWAVAVASVRGVSIGASCEVRGVEDGMEKAHL